MLPKLNIDKAEPYKRDYSGLVELRDFSKFNAPMLRFLSQHH